MFIYIRGFRSNHRCSIEIGFELEGYFIGDKRSISKLLAIQG